MSKNSLFFGQKRYWFNATWTQQDINHTQSATSVQKSNIIQGVRKALQQRGGSKDGNREHEVGGHGNYDDIDDERKLKR